MNGPLVSAESRAEYLEKSKAAYAILVGFHDLHIDVAGDVATATYLFMTSTLACAFPVTERLTVDNGLIVRIDVTYDPAPVLGALQAGWGSCCYPADWVEPGGSVCPTPPWGPTT
jgi:hypothetical protein